MKGQAQYIFQQTPPTFLPQSIVKLIQNPLYQFQSKYIQRIKSTPFINSQALAVHQVQTKQRFLFFNDIIDLPLAQLLTPRVIQSSHINTLEGKSYFPKQEIIKIITCISEALFQLKNQKKNLRQFRGDGYGDLTADTIYYSKSSRKFKLMNPSFVVQSGYLQTLKGQRFSLLSPQQLLSMAEVQQMKQKRPDMNIMDQKSTSSDIFTLGLIVLQCCTLLSSSEVYCPQTYNIYDAEVKKRLDIVQEIYDRQLRDLLQRMLAYDLNERISIQNLVQIVRYQKQQTKRNQQYKKRLPVQ